jgi:hypothetical protein
VVNTGPGDALLFPPWMFHASENLAGDDPEPRTTNNTGAGAGDTTKQSTETAEDAGERRPFIKCCLDLFQHGRV